MQLIVLGGGGRGVAMAYENQNIQLINDNGRSLLSNSVCNNLVKNCTIVHTNNNTHIVIYTTKLYFHVLVTYVDIT